MTENLWGDFSQVPIERTPVVVLREQAELLSAATGEILNGSVLRASSEGGSSFGSSLYIVAPALGNYRYYILRILYGPEPYPVSMLT